MNPTSQDACADVARQLSTALASLEQCMADGDAALSHLEMQVRRRGRAHVGSGAEWQGRVSMCVCVCACVRACVRVPRSVCTAVGTPCSASY
jgi:hypothetical protein